MGKCSPNLSTDCKIPSYLFVQKCFHKFWISHKNATCFDVTVNISKVLLHKIENYYNYGTTHLWSKSFSLFNHKISVSYQ